MPDNAFLNNLDDDIFYPVLSPDHYILPKLLIETNITGSPNIIRNFLSIKRRLFYHLRCYNIRRYTCLLILGQ